MRICDCGWLCETASDGGQIIDCLSFMWVDRSWIGAGAPKMTGTIDFYPSRT